MKVDGARVFVSGGLGFIGRHVVRALVAGGASAVVFDKGGRSPEVLRGTLESGRVTVVHGDLRTADLALAMDGCTAVVHLAANADVRAGEAKPAEVFQDNVLATARVLDGMAAAGIANLGFASTSTVYGEPRTMPTPEDYAPMEPKSVYGSSKLAGEGLIRGFAATHDLTAVIWRFANVVGGGGHGVVTDFVRKLRDDPRALEIFGREPGTRKSYVYIDDAIAGLLRAWSSVERGVEAYNVGSEDTITVRDVADRVCEALGLAGVTYRWTGDVEGGGWKGDVRTMSLAVDKLKALGWAPRRTSGEAVALAAKDAASSR